MLDYIKAFVLFALLSVLLAIGEGKFMNKQNDLSDCENNKTVQIATSKDQLKENADLDTQDIEDKEVTFTID